MASVPVNIRIDPRRKHRAQIFGKNHKPPLTLTQVMTWGLDELLERHDGAGGIHQPTLSEAANGRAK